MPSKFCARQLKNEFQLFLRKRSDETPLPTPSYKYNTWMKNKKKIPYTPKMDEKGIVEAGHLC